MMTGNGKTLPIISGVAPPCTNLSGTKDVKSTHRFTTIELFFSDERGSKDQLSYRRLCRANDGTAEISNTGNWLHDVEYFAEFSVDVVAANMKVAVHLLQETHEHGLLLHITRIVRPGGTFCLVAAIDNLESRINAKEVFQSIVARLPRSEWRIIDYSAGHAMYESGSEAGGRHAKITFLREPLLFDARPYCDRADKARFVWERYNNILRGTVLDVGADECQLRPYLPFPERYRGIGFGQGDQIIHCNLESLPYPFLDRAFESVLCLDVLEHLENAHAAFDELCRLADRWLLVSLPNPYRDLMNFLFDGRYKGGNKNLKFYGLPCEPELDRHRWFFSAVEAGRFIDYRSGLNGFVVRDRFQENLTEPAWYAKLSKIMTNGAETQRLAEFYGGTCWWLLERE